LDLVHFPVSVAPAIKIHSEMEKDSHVKNQCKYMIEMKHQSQNTLISICIPITLIEIQLLHSKHCIACFCINIFGNTLQGALISINSCLTNAQIIMN